MPTVLAPESAIAPWANAVDRAEAVAVSLKLYGAYDGL